MAQAEGDHEWVLELGASPSREPRRRTRAALRVTHRAPEEAQQNGTQWDELSQEVIAGICRSNIDFGAMPTFARSLRCDLDVRISSNLFQPATAR